MAGWIALLLLTFLVAFPGDAGAHAPMTDDCVAPVRPADDQDDAQWRAFLKAIDAFQACVTAESERHLAAADDHNAAAREVVETWNVFVRESLNAPEDFPWPPEADR